MLGVRLAFNMKKRIVQLREIERIINYLEGEIRYKNSLLGEACFNIALKCGQPFRAWLTYLGKDLSEHKEEVDSFKVDFEQDDFGRIWTDSLKILKENSGLNSSDLQELDNLGQALSQTDIQTKERSLMLEKDIIHGRIENLSVDLNSRMRSTIILFFLGGLMTVIVLI